MKKAKYFVSAMLMVACFTQPATAQFEGDITFKSQKHAGQSSDKNEPFTLYITPERIMLQGEKKYNFMESIETEGVLVRLDKEDFVFLTGKDKALKITKTDITSLMNLFGNGQDVSQKAENVSINQERTGETKTIQGYEAEKFIFRDKGSDKNEYFAVWMTKEIEVNWGMLAEPWGNDADQIISSTDFPVDLIFKEKYFPLRFENYKSGELESVLEATEVNKGPVNSDLVMVPSDVAVLNMQNYLFQKMNQ